MLLSIHVVDFCIWPRVLSLSLPCLASHGIATNRSGPVTTTGQVDWGDISPQGQTALTAIGCQQCIAVTMRWREFMAGRGAWPLGAFRQ